MPPKIATRKDGTPRRLVHPRCRHENVDHYDIAVNGTRRMRFDPIRFREALVATQTRLRKEHLGDENAGHPRMGIWLSEIMLLGEIVTAIDAATGGEVPPKVLGEFVRAAALIQDFIELGPRPDRQYCEATDEDQAIWKAWDTRYATLIGRARELGVEVK